MELPNLLAMLALVKKQAEPEAIVTVAGDLEDLLQGLGRPRVLAKVSAIREKWGEN